jgi:two-component system sensor histidine kinase KdpD
MVIVNLVENALKYSPAGTPLAISGRVAADEGEISVRDQGPGVPPGDELKVFSKFYRAAAGREAPDGTGLGLAICQAIIEAHRGTIGVRRPSGGGAEFWFRVPLADMRSDE